MRPIGIDLFAGAGGLSLGFEQAGFDVVASVEIDPIHCAVHEFNFPNSRAICADVSTITGAEIRARAGIEDRDIDVVFGGAPCQGFSLIGKRALDDARNALVLHFVRIVAELRPKYFVFENVKGLTVGRHRKFLIELLEEFEKRGYRVQHDYRVLNAAEYGVPQDRRRLFVMGARAGLPLPAYPEPKTRPPKPDKYRDLFGLPPTPTVADAIGDLPRIARRKELEESDTFKATFGKPSEYAKEMRGAKRAADDYSYPRLYDPTLLTGSMSTKHTPLSVHRFKTTKPGMVEPVSRFLKLHPQGISNTLRAGTNSDKGAFTSPRPIHPKEPRCITNREAARLHSFPDWFRLHVTKWHGFRQIGNSVPPILGRHVGAQVMKALGVKPAVPRKALKLGDPELLRLDASSASRKFGVRADINGRRLRRTGEG